MDNLVDIADKIKKRKLSVLFVEDNQVIMNVTLKSLKLLFKKVDSANNGKEALELLDNGKYDLIITDINIPDLDGAELIREIRKKCKVFPIIITTGYFEFQEIYKEQPNIIVVQKPYDITEVLKALDKFEEIGKVLVEDDIYEKLENSYKEARKVLDMLKNYEGECKKCGQQ